jgi:cytochrome bd-type quinol oxidase subunit 2
VNPAADETAPFWLRIAIVCALFALLRFFGAQMAVNDAFTEFSRSSGLTDWERPGPYIMIAAFLALGVAGAGLFVFRLRSLHRSVLWAAAAIALLVLLALAHSLALYWPNVILQTQAGPLTVSRFIEALLLFIVALSAFWFVRDSQRSGATVH